ncbi:hypothetical protein [Parerythrobacter lacustris]|uniref:CopG family transcriptional regulator n=1 Tax=Parerythrobacter lacustris TaxID=2969984 RepID=A0ABT1XRA4_9SPHN|nr:hypothetical protein [Parerythrobacter lacustris]MCR2833461.1 hypothetical protein [Parerythrobacter lacustris]
MKPTKAQGGKPTRINIKISMKAYRKLSAIAKKEGRTILSVIDVIIAA